MKYDIDENVDYSFDISETQKLNLHKHFITDPRVLGVSHNLKFELLTWVVQNMIKVLS